MSTTLKPPAIGQHWPEQGGTYIGIASDLKGGDTGHLVLLDDRTATRLAWADAMDWAQALGKDARLPTRAEALLLFANAKGLIAANWHWTVEEDDASYAWYCGFDYGRFNYLRKSFEGSAVAVRRLNAQSFNPFEDAAA
jgi:hypothetical protein